MKTLKKYGLYLIRWQLSTPILAGVLLILASVNPLIATIIANLIGGLIFFWVDRFIFKKTYERPNWEIIDCAICADCGEHTSPGYRIIEWNRYDRVDDKNPKWRCYTCANIKKEKILYGQKHKDPCG